MGVREGRIIILSLGYIHDLLVVQRKTSGRSVRSLVGQILEYFGDFVIYHEQTVKHLKIALKEGILKVKFTVLSKSRVFLSFLCKLHSLKKYLLVCPY